MPPNTEQEWSVPSQPASAEIDWPNKTSISAATLEAQLQQERDAKREERFYWIFLCVILADCIVFKHIDDWKLITPIFLLQLIMLIGLADWLGVDRVRVLLEALYARFAPKNGN